MLNTSGKYIVDLLGKQSPFLWNFGALNNSDKCTSKSKGSGQSYFSVIAD